MKKHWLFFQSGTGGHWLSYVADCLVNGDYNFVAQDSHKDSYHNHTLVSERMPLLWVHPEHWKYADFKNVITNNNTIPMVIYEPNYVWNCFQNWLIKHELFYNNHNDISQQFSMSYKAFNRVYNNWNDIENLKNVSPIIYHMLYTDPEKFINRTYAELSRVIPGFNNRDNQLFHKKIEEYKAKCKPYDTLKNTYYWYGFVFGYVLSSDNGVNMLHKFRTHPNGIEWFVNEEYPKYEEQFIKEYVLKV